MPTGLSKIANCRRSMVSIFAIFCLTLMGLYGMAHGMNDVAGIAMSIAGICAALSGANSYQATQTAVAQATSKSSRVDNPG